jgi:hypothetical protein
VRKLLDNLLLAVFHGSAVNVVVSTYSDGPTHPDYLGRWACRVLPALERKRVIVCAMNHMTERQEWFFSHNPTASVWMSRHSKIDHILWRLRNPRLRAFRQRVAHPFLDRHLI